MKFFLVMYLCSMITGQCTDHHIPGYTFESHYDCAIAGYAFSQESLKALAQDEYYFGIEKINEQRLAIKFECREFKGA